MTNEAQPLWRITKVEPIQMYTPTTGSVKGKRVRYILADGTQDYVDIPETEYNAQEVQDRIHHAAMKHEQVMGLVGPDVNNPLPVQTPQIDNVIR